MVFLPPIADRRKTCGVCKQEKNIGAFSRDKSRWDGYDRRCRDCHRAYDSVRNVKVSKQSVAKQKPFQNWTKDEVGAFRVPLS